MGWLRPSKTFPEGSQWPGITLKVLVAQLCLTLWDPMGCSPPGSSVHGILQARILEWNSHSLFKGILLTQGSNSHFRQILYCLSHQDFSSLLMLRGWAGESRVADLLSPLPPRRLDSATLPKISHPLMRSTLLHRASQRPPKGKTKPNRSSLTCLQS